AYPPGWAGGVRGRSEKPSLSEQYGPSPRGRGQGEGGTGRRNLSSSGPSPPDRPSPRPSPGGRGRNSAPRPPTISMFLLLAAISLGALAAASASSGVFRDITRSSGIDFRFKSDLMRLKMIPTMNGGCAFGDYDGDGLPDLYIVNSVPHWGRANTKNCGRLYRN